MKKIFYLLGLFLLLIPFSVNAATWTNKAPSECGIVDTNNTYHKLSCSSVSAWGLKGWENLQSPNPTGSTNLPPKYMLWTYTGSPFLGNDWTIRGQFFTTTESGSSFFGSSKPGMFVNTDYASGIACTVEVSGYAGRSSNYFNFTCSGTSTKMVDLVIYFAGDLYANGSNTYIMLRSDWSEVKTDLSNGSLVGSIDNSIKDSEDNIINNQNNNTSSINNNISAMGSSINNNINEMKDKQDETNQQLGDLNNNITNDSVDDASNAANDFFTGFESNDFGLTSIITAPLNLIKSLTSSTCTPLGFNAPFVDQRVELPCMMTIYKEHFGSFLTLYQMITFGMVAYWVCVNTLATVRGFKDPDSDRIEVLDL